MDSKELLEKLFDEKKLKLMNFFFDNPEDQFYLREIAKRTKIPLTTIFRLMGLLKELEIVKEIKMKKFKLYELNQNKNTKLLQDIVAHKKSALMEFVEAASLVDEVEKIILHGKEEKGKANVLLMGEHLDTTNIKNIVLDIKERFNFSIIDLVLDQEQFNKMSEMGLFPGKRTILFQK